MALPLAHPPLEANGERDKLMLKLKQSLVVGVALSVVLALAEPETVAVAEGAVPETGGEKDAKALALSDGEA